MRKSDRELGRAATDRSASGRLPQATRDLAQYDAAHHEEFKRYEMLKEHERRRYLESLGEEQRKEAEKKLEEQQRRHREHPKVNVPVRTPLSPPLPRTTGREPAAAEAAGSCSLLGLLPQGLPGVVVFLAFLLGSDFRWMAAGFPGWIPRLPDLSLTSCGSPLHRAAKPS